MHPAPVRHITACVDKQEKQQHPPSANEDERSQGCAEAPGQVPLSIPSNSLTGNRYCGTMARPLEKYLLLITLQMWAPAPECIEGR